MAKEQPKREGKQLLLRFPEKSDLRDWLSDAAERNNRSLSAEIIFRLEASRQDEAGHGPLAWAKATKGGNAIDPVQAQIDDLKARVAALESKA